MQERKLTIAENLQKPTLKQLFKNNGTMCFNVIEILVKRFLNSFSFSTKLNAEQIKILTADTIDHFSYESLEDVVLFFKMARSGKFGVSKRGIDGNKIFGEWLPQYLELKAIEREKLITERRKKQEQNINIEAVQQTYKQVEERKQQEQKKQAQQEFIDDIVKNFDRQMLEDTIISWQTDEDLKKYVPLLKLKRKIIK